MTYKIVLQNEAISDIQHAFEWYEIQVKGLGYAFLKEIDNCIEKLEKHPLHYGYIRTC